MLFNTNDSGTIFGAIKQTIINRDKKNQYQSIVDPYRNNKDSFKNADLNKYRDNPVFDDDVIDKLQKIQDEMKKTGKDGEKAFEDIELAMDEVGNEGTKLGNVFKGIGKTIVNALASYAISLAITKLAESIKWLWDEVLTNNAENERTSNAVKDLNERINSYDQENASIDETIQKYTELNEKLKDSNITTSEALEVKEQLLGIQDDLYEKYGNELEGINLVNGGYSEQLELLKQLKKEKSGKFLYGDEGALKKDKKGKSDFERSLEYINSDVQKEQFIGTYKNGTSINDIAGFDIQALLDKYSAINVFDWADMNGSGNYQTGNRNFKFNISGNAKDAQEQFTQFLAELDKVAAENEQARELYNRISSMDIGYDETEYETAMYNAETTIRQLLTYNSSDGVSIVDELENAVSDYNSAYTKFEVEQTEEAKQALIKAEENLNTVQEKAKDITIPNDKTGAAQDVYDQMLNDIINKKVKNQYERLSEYFAQAPKYVRENWVSLSKDLNPDELKIFESLLPEDAKMLTLKDLNDLIEEAKKKAKENPVEIKTEIDSDKAISELDEFEKRRSSIDTIYQEVVVEQKTASASNLESLNSTFGGVRKEVNGKEVYTDMSSALLEFNDEIMKNVDNIDAQKEAFNKLATASIDLDDELAGLKEDNQDYYKQLLKDKDIINAEEVVQSRLNKTYKQTRNNLQALAKAIADNRDELTKYDKDSDEFNGAIGNIKDSVANMLGTYDLNTGKFLGAANIDDQFIKDNLDDIFAMIEGDNDALDRLYQKVAMINAQEILINAGINTDQVEYDMGVIGQMIDWMNSQEIVTQASLEAQPWYSELNNVVNSSAAARDAVNSALSGIGFTANYKTSRKKITVPTVDLSKTNGAINSAYDYRSALVGTHDIYVDDFGLQVSTNNTKGHGSIGSGAKLGGGSSKSSGGGGGGGGGGGSNSGSEPNKPKEESEESFDWIEVAIQRIEEEIARLDKVVGNSYDLWTHRNSALLKELEKTKEEIKAQQIAQSEYLRNANAVKVNDGKGLNPDDYGENDQLVKAADQKLLDEARKAWATGQYQRKVMLGQMSGDDIEKIQNHFLSDTIKTFQELYNKSVAAGDSVQDLKIKLGDLARTNFDNLKSEFEETLSYFESYSSLIDERISRTEEKGYFVSKKYYNDLVNYEKKSLDTLKKEYDGLVKKRDEAVANGYIAANSEEWRFKQLPLHTVMCVINFI